MARLMRCKFCGTLQDEPQGVKRCVQCGGELVFVDETLPTEQTYVRGQLELDQVSAPPDEVVERHVILTVETPDEVPAGERAASEGGRERLNFVAVLDVSGSMGGSKIGAAKEAVRQAVGRLQDGDIFSLVLFGSNVRCPLAPKPIDAGYRRVIYSSLREIRAGGQTALCGGLELGLEQALVMQTSTNLVMVLSDGQANVGETDVETIGRRALEARDKGITVSTLGVGQDYNEALMAEIAIDGGGRFYHIRDAAQIAAYLNGELGEMTSLAARQTKVALSLPAGTSMRSLSAAYPVEGHTVSLGDIPAATELEVVIRLMLPPQGAKTRLRIEGVLSYESPAGHVLKTVLNPVTVRYEAGGAFAPTLGVVKPVMRRVLGQMQAAGVLSTSKAATRSAGEAQKQQAMSMSTMRQYAARLGEDEAAEGIVAESDQVLGMMAAPAPGQQAQAKAATYRAMKRHRGSKDFDQS